MLSYMTIKFPPTTQIPDVTPTFPRLWAFFLTSEEFPTFPGFQKFQKSGNPASIKIKACMGTTKI